MGKRLAKVQSLTGAVALAAFCFLHAIELKSAAGGSRAFADRVWGIRGGVVRLTLECLLVGAPLGIHAALGIWRVFFARPEASGEPYPSRGYAWLQRITGVLAGAFLGVHLGHTWWAKWAGYEPEAVYARLADEVGTPLYLPAYVFGITAVTFHLYQGITAALVRWELTVSPESRRLGRLVSLCVALPVWTLSMNAVMLFATGSSVF